VTREEFEAKLVAMRKFYEPLIEAAYEAYQTALANSQNVEQAAMESEADLRSYFLAFRAKDEAEQIIGRGEPVPKEPIRIEPIKIEPIKVAK
jgi:hypothetical protein